MDGERRTPWDMFEDLDKLFKELNDEFEEEFESVFRQIRPRVSAEGQRIGPIVYGWSMVIGPDGKPVVRQFGNVPRKAMDAEREPLVDVQEGEEEVSVIAEMPGVDKSEIKLNSTPTNLEIKAGQKYYKSIDLPAEVIPQNSKATYKNGVLEVKLQKKEKSVRKTNGYELKVE
ncbi:MAG: archaeal heat shock protein Hsp20 [Thermoprotei archaeon]